MLCNTLNSIKSETKAKKISKQTNGLVVSSFINEAIDRD